MRLAVAVQSAQETPAERGLVRETMLSRVRAALAPRRSLSIRAWLILLVLSATLPLVAYGLFNAIHSYQEQRTQIIASTASAAESLGRATERLLEQQLVGLEALAGAPALQADDFDGFTPLAAHYLATLAPGARLLVSDANGNVRFAIGAGDRLGQRQSLFRRSRPDISRYVFETGRPHVSGLLWGRNIGQYLVALDAPIVRDGAVIADLILSLPVSRIQEVIAAQHIPSGWRAVVTTAPCSPGRPRALT
jgi:hypothetical protein